MQQLSSQDSVFLNYLKALMILGIVLIHCGGSWAYKPYTSVLLLLPAVFFFVSGAVTVYSFERSDDLKQFYTKRLVGLIVPYLLLCAIVFVYYVAVNMQLPPLSLAPLLKWVQINPGNASPFSVQHVWFLQTLLGITIIAPLYFFLLREKLPLLYVIMAGMLVIALVQHWVDLGEMTTLGRIHVEKVMTLSIFYIFGALYYTRLRHLGLKLLLPGLIVCVAISGGTLKGMGVDPDLAEHAYSPDLYFVASGLAAVFIALIARDLIVKAVNIAAPVRRYIEFVSRNVFGIYLLHVMPIFAFSYLFEAGEGRVTVMQGALRFVVALIATSLMTIPFSRVSSRIISRLLR